MRSFSSHHVFFTVSDSTCNVSTPASGDVAMTAPSVPPQAADLCVVTDEGKSLQPGQARKSVLSGMTISCNDAGQCSPAPSGGALFTSEATTATARIPPITTSEVPTGSCTQRSTTILVPTKKSTADRPGLM